MNHDETMAVALANRQFMYRYLWKAFAAEPDEALLTAVADEHTLEQVVLLAGVGSKAEAAQRDLAAYMDEHPDELDGLRGEYTRLFIGPAKLPAPPWESVYVSSDGLIFQACTLEVRRVYREAGYQTAAYPHEADDHLAAELDFMAQLSEDARAAYDVGERNRAFELLSCQRRFLDEHLVTWVGAFAQRLAEGAPSNTSCFYLAFAVLAAEVCAIDETATRELCKLVEG